MRHVAEERRVQYLREDLRGRAATLEEVLGRVVPADEVAAALTVGLSSTLELDLIAGELTPYERELADTLYREKYSTEKWNWMR